MNDTFRLVVNDIKQIEKYENNNKSYLIKLYPEKINLQELKALLDKNLNGRNKIDFAFIIDENEIKIDSKHKFTVNLDFLTKIKDLDGVINIEQIN